MLVLSTEDNKTFMLTGTVVKNAKELIKRAGRDTQFVEGVTYYPVNIGRGVTVKKTEAINVEGVDFNE